MNMHMQDLLIFLLLVFWIVWKRVCHLENGFLLKLKILTFNIVLTYGAQSINKTSQSPYSIFLPTSKVCCDARVTKKHLNPAPTYYISIWQPGKENTLDRTNLLFVHKNYIKKK